MKRAAVTRGTTISNQSDESIELWRRAGARIAASVLPQNRITKSVLPQNRDRTIQQSQDIQS